VAQTLYSTEDVADILGLHVRTVRGYVRDGRLSATRIGKQYRIARDDLDAFTGAHPGPLADGTSQPPRAEASAVVQVAPLGPGAMSRLTTLVTGAASARQDGDDPLHVQTVYDPHRATLKIIVTGTADDTATMLALISTLTREQA
jgi:excisionase family DNA binding protein